MPSAMPLSYHLPESQSLCIANCQQATSSSEQALHQPPSCAFNCTTPKSRFQPRRTACSEFTSKRAVSSHFRRSADSSFFAKCEANFHAPHCGNHLGGPTIIHSLKKPQPESQALWVLAQGMELGRRLLLAVSSNRNLILPKQS